MEVRMEALNSAKPALYPIPENKRIRQYMEKYAAKNSPLPVDLETVSQ